MKICAKTLNFLLPQSALIISLIRPEAVGTIIIQHLLKMAANYRPIEKKISSNKKTSPIKLHSEIVISVPAEFDLAQRNATCRAVESAGIFSFQAKISLHLLFYSI